VRGSERVSKGLDVVVEAGNQKRTLTAAFSYSLPDLLSVNPNFALSHQSSSTVISIFGLLHWETIPRVSPQELVNTAMQQCFLHKFNAVIKCVLSSGAGQGLNVTVDVAGTLEVLNAAFSYVPLD